jgi:hypothetical protein
MAGRCYECHQRKTEQDRQAGLLGGGNGNGSGDGNAGEGGSGGGREPP